MNDAQQRSRVVRLATWLVALSVGTLGAALALAAVMPAGEQAAEGARAFLAWCGIG